MAKRSYLWLFVGLAAVGLTVDQWSKYRVFKWLYNDRAEAKQGAFEAWASVASWTEKDDGKPVPVRLNGGRFDVLPGWFGLVSEYKADGQKLTGEDVDPSHRPCECGMKGLQTWSAPTLPYVNTGALFGLGHDYPDISNKAFAAISVLAVLGVIGWVVWRGRQADGWMLAALGLILGGTAGNLYDRIVFNGVRDFLYFYKTNFAVFNVADSCLVCGAIMLVIHALFFPRPADPPAPATVPAKPA